MIIANVAASFPSRNVSNQEVVELIRSHSKNFEGDLAEVLQSVHTHLDQSGLVNRHWQSAVERPIDHLANAVTTVLQGSALQPADIDLFIYVGVSGGFREPGNSYMAAKSLGMVRAECFDVIDAGMSWTRAVSLVDSLFKTDLYRNAMVVNAEFNMTGGGPLFPANFTLEHPAQLEFALQSYTIGEAATATLLLPDKPDNFRMAFHSKPELAEMCTVPNKGYEGFRQTDQAVGALGAGRFSSKSDELHHHLEQEMPHLLRKAGLTGSEADIVFTHTSCKTAWHKVADNHGFSEKVYHLYPHTGNIVSASIPAALARAKTEGRLRRGHRVMFLMGSAGMSFAACTFDQ